ncbi:MAG: acyltransferase [Polyangiaceae bacterium]|nr:acyltransferase [Polyangiaceae bacterium]
MTDAAIADAEKPRSWLSRFFGLDLLDNRYASLHGLRVVGIVSVVQWHVTWILWGEQDVPLNRAFVDVSTSIFFGMDLFFILSGFLIGSILLRSLERTGSQDLRRFYLRRVLRTFPSYYIVLTILALAYPLTEMQRKNLIFEYTYLTNFVSLHRPDVIMFWGWSMALEEQFYLAVPLLFFILHRLRSDRGRIVLLSSLCVVALVVRLVIYYRWRPWNDFILYGALYFRTYTRFDTLMAGILLALVHRRYRDVISKWLEHPLHRAMLALPALTCLWLLLQPSMFGKEHLQLVKVFSWGTLTSIMYLCALPLLLYSDGIVARVLSAPFFRKVATLGYGLYLVHIPIIDHLVVPAVKTLHSRGISLTLLWIAALATTLLVSWAIAYVMHLFIEKPSLWLRQKIAD